MLNAGKTSSQMRTEHWFRHVEVISNLGKSSHFGSVNAEVILK